jgi:hypothetical protein
MSTRKVYAPFFFREDAVTGTSNLEMLETWLFHKLHEDEPEDFIWQQDGTPPHFRRSLNDALPHRWLGRTDRGDFVFRPWLARSPDITPCVYFLWGYVKDKVVVPPLPASTPDLQSRIVATVETITPDALIQVWQGLDYRLDMCRVSKGAYVEHL